MPSLSVTEGLAERLAALRKRKHGAEQVSKDGLLIDPLDAKPAAIFSATRVAIRQ